MASNFETRDEDVDLEDYRAFFESNILRVWHLNGKKITVRIVRVSKFTSEVYDPKTRKKEVQVQPKLELTNRAGKALSLPLLLNKTNAKTLSGLYGKRPKGWVGKLFTMYPAQVEVGGEQKDGIRIENTPPPEVEPPRDSKAGNGKRNAQGVNVLPPTKQAFPPDPSVISGGVTRVGNTSAERVVVDEDGVVHDGDPYTDGDETEDGSLSTDPPPSSADSLIT